MDIFFYSPCRPVSYRYLLCGDIYRFYRNPTLKEIHSFIGKGEVLIKHYDIWPCLTLTHNFKEQLWFLSNLNVWRTEPSIKCSYKISPQMCVVWFSFSNLIKNINISPNYKHFNFRWHTRKWSGLSPHKTSRRRKSYWQLWSQKDLRLNLTLIWEI